MAKYVWDWEPETKDVRIVRTPAGADRFGQVIGSIISGAAAAANVVKPTGPAGPPTGQDEASCGVVGPAGVKCVQTVGHAGPHKSANGQAWRNEASVTKLSPTKPRRRVDASLGGDAP